MGKNKKLYKTTQRRLENIKGVETVCKSLIKNELIEKLRDNSRYDRFLAVVQLCSSKNMTIEQTVQFIRDSFGGYINEQELTVKLFKKILKEEPDVADAWGYGVSGSEISDIMIKKRAVQLALKADDIETIKTYNEIYGIGGIAGTGGTGKSGTVVRLNISK